MVFSTGCCGCGPKEPVCSVVHCVWVCIRLVSDTNLPTGFLGPQPQHLVLNTKCSTYNLYCWRWAYRCPKHVEIFKIINHNCCIELVPLIIVIYDARSYIEMSFKVLYTGCPRRNVRDLGKVFLMLNYTDIIQNTYIQSWTIMEIMAREVWNFDSCYSLIDYQIHIETGRNMWFL